MRIETSAFWANELNEILVENLNARLMVWFKFN